MAVFEEAAKPKPFEDPSSVTVEDLVGEDKKFASIEDFAKSYAHAQNHISDLELTQSRIATEADQTTAVKELLEELRKKPADSGSPESNTNPEPEATPNVETPETQGRSIEDLIAEKFNSHTAQATAEQNAGQVKDALMKAYGTEDAARSAFLKKLPELGITEEQANQLASENPAVVIKLLELPTETKTGEVTRYSTPSVPKVADPDNPTTIEDFNELRKKDFRKWLEPATQRKLNALVRESN